MTGRIDQTNRRLNITDHFNSQEKSSEIRDQAMTEQRIAEGLMNDRDHTNGDTNRVNSRNINSNRNNSQTIINLKSARTEDLDQTGK